MRILKTMLAALSASLLVLAFAASAGADTEFNKRTTVIFTQPVEIPGQVLPSGTYTIELFESLGNRHIVRIYNKDRSKLIATVLAIPNRRLKPTGENVMKFAERPGNAPDALKAWFYPGDNFGQEFVYPKARAVQLAQVTHEAVPAMENVPAPVEEMKTEPIVAETPEKTEVPIEEALPTTPAQPTETIAQAQAPAALPKTASNVPLIALLGGLFVAFALVLRRLAFSAS
jgi:hypothetical protein